MPQGATLSCPYNFLSPKFVFGVTKTVTCPSKNGSGAGMSGNDPFPFVAPNFLTVGGPFFGVAKNFQWPYSYQLNLSVERQIASNFGVSVAYVGSSEPRFAIRPGHQRSRDRRSRAPACATSSAANIVERRPIDNPGAATCASPGSPFGAVSLLQSNQTASYNGLQTTAQMRMSHGLMFYAFYTFSHTFDSVQLDNNTTQGGAEDMTNLRLERGPADFDLRHQFVASLVWQPNYYKGQNRLERGVSQRLGTFVDHQYTQRFSVYDLQRVGRQPDRQRNSRNFRRRPPASAPNLFRAESIFKRSHGFGVVQHSGVQADSCDQRNFHRWRLQPQHVARPEFSRTSTWQSLDLSL